MFQEFRNIDPNFVKLFRLAQLIIEYLLVSLLLCIRIVNLIMFIWFAALSAVPLRTKHWIWAAHTRSSASTVIHSTVYYLWLYTLHFLRSFWSWSLSYQVRLLSSGHWRRKARRGKKLSMLIKICWMQVQLVYIQ